MHLPTTPDEYDRQTVADCAGFLQRLAKDGSLFIVSTNGPPLTLALPNVYHDGRGRLVIAVRSLDEEE